MRRFERDPETGLILPRRAREPLGKRFCDFGGMGPAFFGGVPSANPNVVLLVTPIDGVGSTTFSDSSLSAWPLTTTAGPVVANDVAPPFGTNKEIKFASRVGSIGVGGTGADWKFLHDGTKWTYQGWFQSADFAAATILFDTSGGTTANVGALVQIKATRVLNVQMYFGSVGNFILNGDFPSGSFPNDTTSYHFIQITCDLSLASNNCTAYVDGVSLGSVTKTGSTSSASSTFALRLFSLQPSALSAIGRAFDVRFTKNTIWPNVVPTSRLAP